MNGRYKNKALSNANGQHLKDVARLRSENGDLRDRVEFLEDELKREENKYRRLARLYRKRKKLISELRKPNKN